VLACDRQLDEDLGAAGESVPQQIKAQTFYTGCLQSADNASVVVIETNLSLPSAPNRSFEEIVTVFDEFRYASLCVDMLSASSSQGDAQELLGATCEARRERSLAEAIGALVDFDGQGAAWRLLEERTSFSECYRGYDEALAQSASASEEYVARQDLAECAADSLRALAEPLKDARCEQEVCGDDLVVLEFVIAGFETAITTSDRACQMLFDASVYRRQSDALELLDCRVEAYSELINQVTDSLP